MSEVAINILRQLGNRQFIVMTGAKNFVCSDDSLRFNIGKNSSKATICRITLQPNDLYAVEFAKIFKLDYKIVKEFDDIDIGNLRTIFSNTTGMHLNL